MRRDLRNLCESQYSTRMSNLQGDAVVGKLRIAGGRSTGTVSGDGDGKGKGSDSGSGHTSGSFGRDIPG